MTISYERQFDSDLLAQEVLNTKQGVWTSDVSRLTWLQSFRKLYNHPEGKLTGRIYAKYLDPINIKSYQSENQSMSFDEQAFKLTFDLYKLHQ